MLSAALHPHGGRRGGIPLPRNGSGSAAPAADCANGSVRSGIPRPHAPPWSALPHGPGMRRCAPPALRAASSRCWPQRRSAAAALSSAPPSHPRARWFIAGRRHLRRFDRFSSPNTCRVVLTASTRRSSHPCARAAGYSSRELPARSPGCMPCFGAPGRKGCSRPNACATACRVRGCGAATCGRSAAADGFSVSISGTKSRSGWQHYRFTVCTEKGTRSIPARKDPYMKGFRRELTLRPSCYACPFKSGRSGSDLTLCDLWNVAEAAPQFDDDRGASLVLANTEAGAAHFRALDTEHAALSYDERVRARNGGFSEQVAAHPCAEFFSASWPRRAPSSTCSAGWSGRPANTRSCRNSANSSTPDPHKTNMKIALLTLPSIPTTAVYSRPSP